MLLPERTEHDNAAQVLAILGINQFGMRTRRLLTVLTKVAA